MPENRGRKGNVVMAKEVYVEDLLEDFIAIWKEMFGECAKAKNATEMSILQISIDGNSKKSVEES